MSDASGGVTCTGAAVGAEVRAEASAEVSTKVAAVAEVEKRHLNSEGCHVDRCFAAAEERLSSKCQRR